MKKAQSIQEKPFDLDAELARIQTDDVFEETNKFLDAKNPMQVRVTTSQQIVNMNDHNEICFVIDLRSSAAFEETCLDKSVNFAIEKFNEEAFIFWPQFAKKLEADTRIFKNKQVQNCFKRRRRYWVYLIAAQTSKNIDQTLLELSAFGNKEGLAALVKSADTEQKKQDLLSLRNAFLLYNALKKERLREIDICIDGFDKIRKHYEHFCLQNNELIIERP